MLNISNVSNMIRKRDTITNIFILMNFFPLGTKRQDAADMVHYSVWLSKCLLRDYSTSNIKNIYTYI